MLLEEIVIGRCLESATYALLRDSYYLATFDNLPLFYEEPELKFLGSAREDYTLCRVLLMLSLQGRLLNFQNVQRVKLENLKLKYVSDNKTWKYSFDQCVVFDSAKLEVSNQILKSDSNCYLVYDDFELSCLGSKHSFLPHKISSELFGGKIYYYISDRVDGANYVTDCVVESRLSKQQINSVEYSDSMVRFLVERHLSSIGIKGNVNGKYKSGKLKYRKPKVKHARRIVKTIENNQYADSERIRFVNFSLEEVFGVSRATRP